MKNKPAAATCVLDEKTAKRVGKREREREREREIERARGLTKYRYIYSRTVG